MLSPGEEVEHITKTGLLRQGERAITNNHYIVALQILRKVCQKKAMLLKRVVILL